MSAQVNQAKGSKIKFCPMCNNMLYPKEDKQRKKLLYACRQCSHEVDADNNCVQVNVIAKTEKKFNVLRNINHEIIFDPTYPRVRDQECPKCGHGEMIFLQPFTRSEDSMRLCFVCTSPSCKHKWLWDKEEEERVGGVPMDF